MDLLIRDVQPQDAAALVTLSPPIIESGRYIALDTPLTLEAE